MKRVKSWISGGSVALVQLLAVCILFVGIPAPKASAYVWGSHYTYFMEPNCQGNALPWRNMDAGEAYKFGANSAQNQETGICKNIKEASFWSKAACIGAAGAIGGVVGGAIVAAATGAAGFVAGGTVVVTLTAGQALAAAGLAGAAGAVFHATIPSYSCMVRLV